MPYAKLQAAAKRCGLGTLDFRPIRDARGAARYVAKYVSKGLGEGTSLGKLRRWASNVPDPTPKPEGWAWTWRRVATVAVEEFGAIAVDWDATFYEASAG